jgi:hypothetical protein
LVLFGVDGGLNGLTMIFLLQMKIAMAYSAHPRRQNPVARTLIFSGERMNVKLNEAVQPREEPLARQP